MTLSDFLSNPENEHKKAGNPAVKCNALYKKQGNLNCYLTVPQAVELARHLLAKAQLLLDHDVQDGVVHLWNQGDTSETLHIGLNKARKGPRRQKRPNAAAK